MPVFMKERRDSDAGSGEGMDARFWNEYRHIEVSLVYIFKLKNIIITTMILTEDFTEKPLISHCSEQGIHIQEKVYENPILITPTGDIAYWPTRCIEDITHDHYQQFLAHQPEVIIVGAGLTQSLPDPTFIAYFARHHIGVEIMNTAAACRTYNVLALENRRVLAILLFENELTPSC